jgi:hypothetical protein
MKGQEKARSMIFRLVFGFILFLIGYLGTIDAAVIFFGWTIRIFAAFCHLSAVLLLASFFATLPPFSEYDWQDSIEELLLISNAGTCFYYKDFKNNFFSFEANMENIAISGVLSMVKSFLDRVTAREGISVFKKGSKVIIISPFEKLSGIVICKEELNNLKLALKSFVMKVELIYGLLIPDFENTRDLSFLKPIENIAKNIFS